MSETTLNDLRSGKNTLILQPLWQGNPDMATPELVEEVIRTKRLFLFAFNDNGNGKREIFHDDSLGLKNVQITRIVRADLDTEAEVKAYPHRVVEVVSGKTWLRKNKAEKCLVTKLSEIFDCHIDRSKYTVSTVSGIVEELFRVRSSAFQKALSSDPESIHKRVGEALEIAKARQQKQLEERRRQQEEARKQEADAARREAADKLAQSLRDADRLRAQNNFNLAQRQYYSTGNPNGYYGVGYQSTSLSSTYYNAQNIADGIAGVKRK